MEMHNICKQLTGRRRRFLQRLLRSVVRDLMPFCGAFEPGKVVRSN